jgi:hypothetical protein
VLTLSWLALACAYHKGRSFADVLGLTINCSTTWPRAPTC